MIDDAAPHGRETVRVELEPAIFDDRGIIQPLVEAQIRSTLLISSKKGSIRADHYHLTDWHYLYVISGRMAYWHRPQGSTEPPQRTIVETGGMVFSPPLVEHRTDFLEDTVFITISRNPRDQDSYEADVRRVSMPISDTSSG